MGDKHIYSTSFWVKLQDRFDEFKKEAYNIIQDLKPKHTQIKPPTITAKPTRKEIPQTPITTAPTKQKSKPKRQKVEKANKVKVKKVHFRKTVDESVQKILVIGLSSVIITIFGLGVFLTYKGSLYTQTSYNKSKQVKVTPTPDSTAEWKTYKNEKYSLSFKYPKTWNIAETINKSTPQVDEQLVINITDNVPLQKPRFDQNYSNQLLIYNDRGKVESEDFETASNSFIDYTISYIPGISYNKPKISKISNITFTNQKAILYEITLGETAEYSFTNNKILIIHCISGGKIWSIEQYGEDKSAFNRVISTFKFLE